MATGVKPIIYQLVVRYFGNTNPTRKPAGSLTENGCGKFVDVSDTALASIKALGATHVWLTGCHRQATLTDWSSVGLPPDDPDVVKGVAGSFYAIRDYFDVCPDYAVEPANRLAEFDAMIGRVHAAGLKAVLDFVPNHVARGYESVVRPDLQFGAGDDTTRFFVPGNHFFYVADGSTAPLRLTRPQTWNPPGYAFDGLYDREDGTPERPVKVTGDNVRRTDLGPSPWYETIKLNYGYDFQAQAGRYDPRPRTWDLMDAVLAYWQARGADGFRCDFAHYVPAEAWAFLLGRVRERDPDAYLFAEAYPWEGSGDPVVRREQLVAAGFDAVYNDYSTDCLKKIYLGWGGQDDYHHAITGLGAPARRHMVQYLENHDERRIGSPVNPAANWTGNSGFGTADAGYLLAPLQYLCGPGPVLMLNGQEIGEPGADAEGYSGLDGRTTLFDYWSMPEFAKWVNGHAYDGGGLDDWQKYLRAYYGRLLALCQDEAVRGDGFWGLKYFNRPDRFGDCPDAFYSFARFVDGGRRLVLVVGNFDARSQQSGRVRVPAELAELCALPGRVGVRLLLSREAGNDQLIDSTDAATLTTDGLNLLIPAQTAHVYEIVASR